MGNRRNIVFFLLLFALVFILFGDTIRHGFNSDDYLVIYHAIHKQSLHGQGGFLEFLSPSWGLYYRPAIKVFFELLANAFNVWPGGYHLVSLMCYGGLCFEVYLLGWLLTEKRSWALASAIIFMTSSAHAEAVFWISSLNGVIENILTFASLICFIRWRRTGSLAPYLCSVGLFMLALLTKESAISLPLILVSYDLLLGGGKSRGVAVKRTATSCLPFVLLGILFMAVRHVVMKGAHLPPALTSFDWRIMIVGLWYSLIMALSPIDWALTLNWFDKLAGSGTAFSVVEGFAILAVAIVPLLLRRFRITFLLWWILAGAAPVLGLGLVPSERHMVLGTAGAAILVAVALFKLSGRLRLRANTHPAILAYAFTIVFAGTSCYFLKQRQAIWKQASEITGSVIEQTIRLCPSPPPGTTFFFLNIPDSFKSALVFRFDNLAYALRLFYDDNSIDAVRMVTVEMIPDSALFSTKSAYFKIGAMGGHVYFPGSSVQEPLSIQHWQRVERLGILARDGRYAGDWSRYDGSPLLVYRSGALLPAPAAKLKEILENLYSLK